MDLLIRGESKFNEIAPSPNYSFQTALLLYLATGTNLTFSSGLAKKP
jgi:hypothetical protein